MDRQPQPPAPSTQHLASRTQTQEVLTSLVKKLMMTEKKVAANRRNQNLSHGPVTAEGKERISTAQLSCGFYAKAQ
jgi:hypothetical protein